MFIFYFSENSEIAEERAERDLSNDDTELVSENITESLQHWVIIFSINYYFWYFENCFDLLLKNNFLTEGQNNFQNKIQKIIINTKNNYPMLKAFSDIFTDQLGIIVAQVSFSPLLSNLWIFWKVKE